MGAQGRRLHSVWRQGPEAVRHSFTLCVELLLLARVKQKMRADRLLGEPLLAFVGPAQAAPGREYPFVEVDLERHRLVGQFDLSRQPVLAAGAQLVDERFPIQRHAAAIVADQNQRVLAGLGRPDVSVPADAEVVGRNRDVGTAASPVEIDPRVNPDKHTLLEFEIAEVLAYDPRP